MGFLRKKADPISERSKALNAQIASLEAQIKRLDHQLQQGAPTARRPGTNPASPSHPNGRSSAGAREPVFEPVDHRLEPSAEAEHSAGHYNDLGVRKYDLAASWRRWRGQFRGPPASNPKLVTYLAAGSIRGLRPLRYEKRVARNRILALFLILLCLLWGIIAVFVGSH
jgi:hypothetical protein